MALQFCLRQWLPMKDPAGYIKPISVLRSLRSCSNLFQKGFRVVDGSLCTRRSFGCSAKRFVGYDQSDPVACKLPDLTLFPPDRIRNFSIIAHVDHGKSTLADRLLEMAGNIQAGSHDHQVLDRLEVERERGITVKAVTASLFYELDGKKYLINLIDTPGHVDFNWEVHRSLTASQGVVLLVDANQGVQAQTLANFYAAFDADKAVIPVLNKIDLKQANPEAVAQQMQKALDINPQDVLKISAKLGTGVDGLLRAVIEKVPPPTGKREGPLRGMLFDSWYDKHRGVIALVAIVDGQLKRGDMIMFSSSALQTNDSTPKIYEVKELGIVRPDRVPTSHLFTGQVGYIICNMRSTKEAMIGSTFFQKDTPVAAIAPVRKAKPMVYAGVYPTDQGENESLRNALDRLVLNDASVSVQMEHNLALGQGWRLGFLGLLHMEVFLQRLDYEHEASCISTIPSVPYRMKLKSSPGKAEERNLQMDEDGWITIVNPEQMPELTKVQEFQEPWVLGSIITPAEYMGEILSICMDRRGQQKNVTFLDQTRVLMQFYLPLSEVIVDLFDILKSRSSGFASFDYEDAGYRPIEVVRMDFLLNSKPVGELSMIVPTNRIRDQGLRICSRLKEEMPQQQFPVVIQAVVGGKIVARENLKALRKDVIAQKIYSHGGRDKGRKEKLLKRQKEGKERMRNIGDIVLPRDCFIQVLRKPSN